MKEHIATRNLRDGAWRAFASQMKPFTTKFQRQVYMQLETSSELGTDSVFSFLATTDSLKRIVGKIHWFKHRTFTSRF